MTAMTGACVGAGSLVLDLFGVDEAAKAPLERAVFGFVVGIGVLGWLLFFLGLVRGFSPLAFWAIAAAGVAAGVAGSSRFRRGPSRPVAQPLPRTAVGRGVDIGLVLALAAVLVFDLLEGVSPPADADSLAYHFAIPQHFVATEAIEFIPRAISGAIPLLVHMTYTMALGMGGDLALTLWAMTSGWGTALLVYVLSRRFVSRRWALALAIVFLTTPAVIYGGGSGHVEVRTAAFALLSAWFLADAVRTGNRGCVALAGFCAGFFMAAKYFGLIFAGAAGLTLLFRRRWRLVVPFAGAMLAAGAQWYLWNWWHTGDPLFPSLYALLGLPPTDIWSADFGAYSASLYAEAENPLGRTLLNWAIYPLYATFDLVPQLESGRTGFGVFCLLLLPLAVAGAMVRHSREPVVTLFLAVAAIFYTVWFFSGTTQRARHLLSIYPLVVVGIGVYAVAATEHFRLTLVVPAAVGLTIAIQLAGHGLFSVNYVRHVFAGESPRAFYARNVQHSRAAFWIVDNLPPGSRVGIMERQLVFLLEGRAYMMHPGLQMLIDSRPETDDPARFSDEARKLGLTHLLLGGEWLRKDPDDGAIAPFFRMIRRLARSGCLVEVARFQSPRISSRTLSPFREGDATIEAAAFRFRDRLCPSPGNR